MKTLLTVVTVVLLSGAAWFFLSPLFIDQTVDEAFEFTLPDGRIDMAKIDAMSDAERAQMREPIMAAAASAPKQTANETMPTTPVALANGQFVDADAVHKGSGTATLYRLPDNTHLVRFEDFNTTNGPALVVYLAQHPNPSSAADVTDNGFLELGKLKGNVGNQNYPIPPGTDVSQYQSVVIWCELFDVLFSPAALTAS